MPSTFDWPSGYGPPPEPPPRDYTSPCVNDDRLRTRFEACRSGMQELDALRSKHATMIQNLRSRLPIIPGCLDDVQTREKKSRDVILDRFSLQSVDSGISSQNTMNSTRSSSPETDWGIGTKNNNRTSFENSTINYSTFRKLSLESNQNNMSNPAVSQIMQSPPVITSRSCHRGAWKTSPKKIRPKSMFENSSASTEYLFEKPPKQPIDLRKNRQSAFTLVHRNPDLRAEFSNMSLEDLRTTPQKSELQQRQKLEKVDAMFRANVVYLSSTNSPEQLPRHQVVHRFSPSRSPPIRRSLVPQQSEQLAHAMPCKIRSPILNSKKNNNKNVFSAKPISVRPSLSPKISHPHSTWLQSQPL